MMIRKCVKSLKLLLALALTVSCVFMTSCDLFCVSGDEYDFAGGNRFGFTIVDRFSKENLLRIGQINYNYDTLRVYSADWAVAYPERNQEWEAWDGRVYLMFIDRNIDENVIDRRVSRRFYFYFDYQDIDTIDIQFEMRRGQCDEQIMKYFNVDYNNTVYFDSKTDFVPYIEFFK